MKTRITTLLMIFALLVSFTAIADETPESPKSSAPGWYLGPPYETPRQELNSIESRIAIFFADLFFTDSWRHDPKYVKKSFKAKKPTTD